MTTSSDVMTRQCTCSWNHNDLLYHQKIQSSKTTRRRCPSLCET